MAPIARRLQHAAYGDPEVLEVAEVPLPEPGPGQVRVRVHAAGANALDSKKRRGLFAPGQDAPAEPQPLGLEMAGVIDALGPGVTRWKTGQPVLGLTAQQNAVATHALADADNIVAKPDVLTFEQAAALPVAAETAHRTLRRLGLGAGQTLLVHAAAGGVGLMAVQFARAWGATVIGTASEANHPFLRDLGATPVTYGDGLAERIRAAAPQGIDVVLDASGRGVLPLSVELTGDPEKVITIADLDAARHGVRFSSGMLPIAQAMTEILPMIEDGSLRIPIEAVFPLERAADAYRRLDNGHLRGKVVITARTPLDPAARAVLDMAMQPGVPQLHELSAPEARAAMDGMWADLGGEPAAVARAEDAVANGVPVKLYWPEGEGPHPVLIWIHGGGWTLGSAAASDATARDLCRLAGYLVVSVDYRLAPEHPFPAAVEDVRAVAQWVSSQIGALGGDTTRMAVGGDSAGANLSAVLANELPGTFALQVLVYPATDLTHPFPSYEENGEGLMLTKDALAWFQGHYLGDDVDPKDPRISPLYTDAATLATAPPALVITAGYDPLRDEGEAYAQRLREAGVTVEQVSYEGQIHGFFSMPAAIPAAREALERVTATLRRAWA
ncbi:alpha/beta hydrolase fold domain-containing protein [Streptomyces sp. 205]|uniref:Alpha/beta hydrolase fold domain-containing protein n=1 Tax=Streptomyces coffeae TaxID=621382 RepID=A0ABS1NES0_9ACTN|nr:alpha/beta hydrolase fold domain-containing protein [Streptomyces coffeae]MBL1098484.1 alpha/beta hydrolase fold domain-containing protein [Streptomyces coffeae]